MHKILFSLPASLETYQGLGNFMFTHSFKQEMYEVVDEVIDEWMTSYAAAKSKRLAGAVCECGRRIVSKCVGDYLDPFSERK